MLNIDSKNLLYYSEENKIIDSLKLTRKSIKSNSNLENEKKNNLIESTVKIIKNINNLINFSPKKRFRKKIYTSSSSNTLCSNNTFHNSSRSLTYRSQDETSISSIYSISKIHNDINL